MVENFEEPGHGLKGPHWDPKTADDIPADFAPLRLELQRSAKVPQRVILEVARPIALVGRHTSTDVRLAYPEVSRRHCRLAFNEGFWHIVDLNSLNGLFVNGERVHEAVLQDGDFVRVGSVTMVVLTREEQVHPWPAVLRSIAQNMR